MLLDNFFFILTRQVADQSIKTRIRIDKHHKIFNGHFPAIPIVPGVCMLEIIREIVEQHFGHSFRIASADSIKFLTVINPVENDEVQADIDFEANGDDGLRISATLFAGELIFFKLKGLLQSQR
jgi:3-hydroxyacyl-[acyl-carrier-protein] dehydratase